MVISGEKIQSHLPYSPLKIAFTSVVKQTINIMGKQVISRKELETGIIAKTWNNSAFKEELFSNPKAVYEQELGQSLPPNLQINVVEEDANNFYLVVPSKPQVLEELSDEALKAIAGGYVITIGPAVNLNMGVVLP